jgi:hypothetical protein
MNLRLKTATWCRSACLCSECILWAGHLTQVLSVAASWTVLWDSPHSSGLAQLRQAEASNA